MSENKGLPDDMGTNIASSPRTPESDIYHSPALRTSDPKVGFRSQESESGEGYKEREKYLTAKYPKHTRGLIRRRLAVEDWIDEQLKKLYNVQDENAYTFDVCIDLDEVLEINEESQRIEYIEEQIADAPESPSVKKKFIDELLEKAKDL